MIKQPILNPFRRKGLAIFVVTILLSLPFGKGWGWAAKAQVVANFSATPIKGCAPIVVNFTDHSTGSVTSWSWNFGNGQTSVFQNPTAVYTNSGVYTVTLTVSNGSSSNTIVQTNYITVYANPTAGFTLNTYTACVEQPIKYTDATVISSGGAAISNWAWGFGDGTSQTVTTPTVSHSYSTPGNYPISLIVTDLNGCTNAITETVVIVPPPTPSFMANPVSGCSAPLSVTFTNTSISSGATTYSWHFGDGGTSNQTNPTHTYTVNGSYTVTLIVNQNGCIDSIVMPNYINIQNMNASFVPTPSVVCSGQSITFTNTSIPTAVSANWSFGDGGTSTTISPVHTYTAAGTYTVSLAATGTGGCSGNATEVVTVNQTPVAAFVADTMVACSIPFVVTFSNTTTGASTYHWNFGDGNTSAATNPINTYTVPGTYTVTLKATNSTGTCADSIVKNSFIVISPPVAGYTATPDSGCVPLVVSFTSNSTSALFPITSYTWSYGDGNSNITAVPNTNNTYTLSGIYSPTIAVQTGRGCTNTFVCTNCIRTGNAPVASFTISPDSVCYGSPIMPINTSTGATGWTWLFGDGQTSIMQNPLHIYADTGKYQIKLVAYNHGCTDTSIATPVIVLAPKAQFNYTLSCTTYFKVLFSSTSEGADSLVWKFGDGTQNTSNTTHPVHTYTATGAVTCTLIAYNYKSHCVDSSMSSFTIAKPIASFTDSDSTGCYPFTPVFTSTSQDANTYFWNFGIVTSTSDTANIANPSYTYNTPGKDLVKLVITDVNGCKDSITKKLVTMGPLPYFRANKLKGCATPGLLVTFTDSTISDSGIVQWNWNYGDGTTQSFTTLHNPPHLYNTPGSYNVTLVVTDKDGCKDSLVKVDYINPTYPIPNYSVLPLPFSCKGNTLTFNGSTTNAVGPSYSWNFGDGTPPVSSGYNPVTTHSYAADGLYHVTLTVTDTNGCSNQYPDTVLILKPKANFDSLIISTGCGNMQVAFNDLSSGFPNSWQWNFGNGAISILQNPNYTYTQPGSYNVTLIVTNPGGCSDTITKDSVLVVPGPVGSFSFTPASGCNPLKVNFVGQSTNTENYHWFYGDGADIISGSSITHTYNQVGVFNPVLVLTTTTTAGPCSLSYLDGTVTVINGVNVSVTPNTLTLGEDSSAAIAGTAGGGHAPYTYSWTPSTTNISCITCPDINVTGTGDTLVYTLTATDLNGCQGTATLLVISTPCIDKKRIPNIFTPNGDNTNDGFYIPGLCPEENYSLVVYDRWGSLQFTATERNHAWDGKTTKGADAPDGTYFFIVKVNGNTYKGFVQLIR